MKQEAQTSRRGAVLVCVLVCVGIASTILLTALSASLRARRQLRHEMQMEQTRWLVEAAMIRGASAVREENDYQGETWDVADALSTYAHAEVTITVDTAGPDDGRVQLSISAEIRGSDPLSKTTRRSDQRVVDRPDLKSEN